MTSENDTHVLVDVVNCDIPPKGIAQLVIKLTGPDKDIIDTAARLTRRSQQEFMRAVLVNSAKKFLELRGVEVELTGRYIDLSATDD